MSNNDVIEREIKVTIVEHRDTHLLVAISNDLSGLFVAGRTIEQIERELPTAIREVLEANGHEVYSVTADENQGQSRDFLSRTILANAVLNARQQRGSGA
ncbi:DUF1902 domain-containing protein [Roseicella frigidaeris]|uniref:Uncharacterized protein n=1 Tax=Roseicella frigidaeris TaxID=2230885 RepID=A0A327M135_9PROT|nr:DUF1902 domain-containing protein [Roseicella frigidaeris]RAI55903.1 hypothetical protein DOO78_23425 [Roseicella frigidaeris]